MAIDFDKWNEDFGGEDAVKETKEAAANQFKEVPDGNYVCRLEKLELGEARKTGKPMLKGQFRICEGEFKKQCLFVNQVCTSGFPMHKALEFLRSLDVLDEMEVDFNGNYADFNDLLLDIAEESEGLRFLVKKSKDGDYTRIECVETYED